MKNRGFTLLEMLVSIAIFSVIGVASFEVLTRMKSVEQTATAHSELLEQWQRANWTMERDFMQVAVRKVRQDGDDPSTHLLMAKQGWLESDSAGVSFTRAGWTNPFGLLARGTVQGVGYRIQEGRLERLTTLYPDMARGTEPKVRVLLEHIDAMKLKFYSDKTWQENWEQENKLPEAVEVTLESETYGDLRWVFLMTGASLE